MTSGIAIMAMAENSRSQASRTEKTSMAKARALASPSPSTRLAKSGTKALLKAPSANSARNRLGKRCATKKASAIGPVPSVKAINWSRRKPSTRLTSVRLPTVAADFRSDIASQALDGIACAGFRMWAKAFTIWVCRVLFSIFAPVRSVT